LNPNEGASSFESININPVLVAIKVLKVEQNERFLEQEAKVNLILELTRKQVAKLSIAKSIATLEVHKSVGPEQAALLHANSGDVLPEYRAIVEYRAGSVAIR
jgi:pilus assembly protein CpaB